MEQTICKCSDCGATVTVTGGDIYRECDHVESAVIADIQAITYGESSMQ